MNYKQFPNFAKEILEKAQIDKSNLDFEIEALLLHFSQFTRTELLINRAKEIPEEIFSRLCEAVKRRAQGEPLQYILGEWEFYGLRMFVGEGCLIPRPETELLVDTAVKMLKKGGHLLDLCTGSGCIPLAVLNNRKDATAQGVDISDQALFFAEKNLCLHKMSKRLTLTNCDIYDFEPIRMPDIIVSNPPYIKSEDVALLQKEVSFEPALALDGGHDGLDFYKLIVKRYSKYLSSDGIFLFEVGYDIPDEVCAILHHAGFKTKVLCDLSGVPRVCVGRRE